MLRQRPGRDACVSFVNIGTIKQAARAAIPVLILAARAALPTR